MADPASAQRSAPHASAGRWFQKDGGSPLDRLPVMLEGFADVAKAWTASFTSVASAPGEATLADLRVCKVAEIADRRGAGTVLALIHAPGWKTTGAVAFDRTFIMAAVEAMFGGSGEDLDAREPTPLSTVDLSIADLMAKQIAAALEVGFARRLPSTFHVEQIQLKIDTGFLGKPTAGLVAGTLALAILGVTVEAEILVPLAALMVFADELATIEDDETVYADERWTQRLETEVARATMSLSAVVDLDPMTLGTIARLQPGQVIQLPVEASKRVRLSCGGNDLFRCDLGQSTGFYTVRIEETIGSIDDLAASPMSDEL